MGLGAAVGAGGVCCVLPPVPGDVALTQGSEVIAHLGGLEEENLWFVNVSVAPGYPKHWSELPGAGFQVTRQPQFQEIGSECVNSAGTGGGNQLQNHRIV